MSLVAVDCETYLISPGNLTPKIVCGSWASEHGEELCTPEAWLGRLNHLLRDPNTVLCGANIAFDFGCAIAAGVPFDLVWAAYEQERVFDVSIAATLNAIADGRLTDEGLFRADGTKVQKGRYSLEECVREFLGRDDAKANDEWRLRYAELDGTPLEQWPEVARQYPVDDAVNTWKVAAKQLSTCRNLGNQGAQAHAAFCAHLGAIWGLRTDPQNVAALKAKVESHIREGEALQKSLGLLRAKVKKRPEELSLDTKALADLVTAAYQGQPPLTATGRPSTSRETLEDSGDPTLKKLAEVSKWEKLQTYLPSLEAASTAPLNVRVNPVLATGRASYEGLIQLMPRKGGVRECFVARPGRLYSSVDYAAIEMSTLAQVCLWAVGTSALAEAINSGKDVHSLFAATMLVQDYDDFVAHKKEPERAAKRQAAKACLGAGTKVLTRRGWVPIVQVTTQDEVWDGEQWVTHDGLLYQGVRETQISRAVEATPDHGVLTEHGWREWSEVRTSPFLFRSALSLATLPSSPGSESSQKVVQQASPRWSGAPAASSFTRRVTSYLTVTLRDAVSATIKLFDQSGILPTRQQCRMRPLEPAFSTGSMLPSTAATTLETRTTPTTAVEVFESQMSGSRTSPNSSNMRLHFRALMTLICRWTGLTMTEATSLGTSGSPLRKPTSETEILYSDSGDGSQSWKRRSPVYDLLNAGPRHRFTVLTSEGPLIVSNCNFGYPGMMGAAKLVAAKRREGEIVCRWHGGEDVHNVERVRDFGTQSLDAPTCVACLEYADELRRDYLAMWPEVPRYWQWVQSQLAANDEVVQFVSERIRGGLRPAQAANTLFQGLAADGAKRAVVALTREMYLDRSSPLFGSRLVVFSHDETILEVPEETAHEAAHRQAEVMVASMREVVPDVLVKAEPALMKHWSKDAVAVYRDVKGERRLVAWDS